MLFTICYLPADRSELGKTVPEVLSTVQGRQITYLHFLYDIVLKATFVLNFS